MGDNGWRDVLLIELTKAYEVQEGLKQRKLFILRLSILLAAAVAAFVSSGYLPVEAGAHSLTALLSGNSSTIAFLGAFSWLFGGLGFTYAQLSIHDTKISNYIVNTLQAKLLSSCATTAPTGLLSLPTAIYPRGRFPLLSMSSVAGVLVTLPGVTLYVLVLVNYYKTFSSLGWYLHLGVIVGGVLWCILARYGRVIILYRYRMLQKAWKDQAQEG